MEDSDITRSESTQEQFPFLMLKAELMQWGGLFMSCRTKLRVTVVPDHPDVGWFILERLGTIITMTE